MPSNVATLPAVPMELVTVDHPRFRRQGTTQAGRERSMNVLMMERPQPGNPDSRDVATIRMEFGGGAVEMRHPYLQYMLTEHFQGPSAVFGISSRASVRFRTFGDQLKQELYLYEDPGTNVFDEVLALDNLALVLNEGGSCTYNDAAGIPVGSIPAPVVRAMSPATGQVLTTTGLVELIPQQDGSVIYRILVDPVWLSERFAAGDVVVIDPTTITTSTSGLATAYSNQRKIARFSNGVLFAMFSDGTNMVCRYSSDNGSTWGTPTTGATIGAYSNGAVYIDASDNLYVVMGPGAYYRSGTADAGRTGYTWNAVKELAAATYSDYPDVVGKDGYGHVVFSIDGASNNKAHYSRVDSGNSIVSSVDISNNYTTSIHVYPSISIDSSGNLYAIWSAGTGNGIRAKKATYSGGSWTWGSEETATASYYANSGYLSSVLDSSGRVIAALRRSDAGNYLAVWQRSTGGTWTDISPSTVAASALSVVTDTDDNVYVFYAASGTVYYQKYTRSGGTWGLAVTVEGSTSNYPSLRRETSGSAVDALYIQGSGSPYNVRHYRLSLNQAPTAPTLTTHANYDAVGNSDFLWTFNDDDPGDTQSSFQLQIRDVAAGTDTVDTGKTAGSSGSHTVSGATLTNNKQYQWRVKTWDALDTEGAYSAYGTFYTSAKPAGTITFPAVDGDTVNSSSLTGQHSVSDPESGGQSAYQYRLLSAADAELWTSGKVASVSGRSQTIGYTLVNSTNYKLELTVWDAKDVVSTAVVRTFNTSFTPPADPEGLTATAYPGKSSIRISWSAPDPGAGVETDTYRVARKKAEESDDAYAVLEDAWPDTAYEDFTPASGQQYTYKVSTIGTNGILSAGATATGSVSFAIPHLIHPTDNAQNLALPLTPKNVFLDHPQSITTYETLGATRKSQSMGEVLGAEGELVIVADHRDPRTYDLATKLRARKTLNSTWLLKLPGHPGPLMTTIPGKVFEVTLGAMREVISPNKTVITIPFVEVGDARE